MFTLEKRYINAVNIPLTIVRQFMKYFPFAVCWKSHSTQQADVFCGPGVFLLERALKANVAEETVKFIENPHQVSLKTGSSWVWVLWCISTTTLYPWDKNLDANVCSSLHQPKHGQDCCQNMACCPVECDRQLSEGGQRETSAEWQTSQG